MRLTPRDLLERMGHPLCTVIRTDVVVDMVYVWCSCGLRARLDVPKLHKLGMTLKEARDAVQSAPTVESWGYPKRGESNPS